MIHIYQLRVRIHHLISFTVRMSNLTCPCPTSDAHVNPNINMLLQTSVYNEGTRPATYVHLGQTCIRSFTCQISNNERYSLAYKRHNTRFQSDRGCHFHPVVGSKSFAYFLILMHNTSFIGLNGCPCPLSSTYFFKPPRAPPQAGCTSNVCIASSFSPSESSAREFVACPWLHKKNITNTLYEGPHT